MLTLPPDVKSINFYTVQTFSKTSEHTAALTEVSVVSDLPDTEQFQRCEKDTLMAANLELTLPDSVSEDKLQITDQARLAVNRDPSPAEVEQILAEAKKELNDTPIDSPHHKMIQMVYDSYSCFASRHSMSECL